MDWYVLRAVDSLWKRMEERKPPNILDLYIQGLVKKHGGRPIAFLSGGKSYRFPCANPTALVEMSVRRFSKSTLSEQVSHSFTAITLLNQQPQFRESLPLNKAESAEAPIFVAWSPRRAERWPLGLSNSSVITTHWIKSRWSIPCFSARFGSVMYND